MMELIARYDKKWPLFILYYFWNVENVPQHIKVRVWPLWNQKLNKDIMERLVLFSWTPTQNWTRCDILSRTIFLQMKKNYKMFTWWLTCLFCIKFKPCSVLQTGSNLDFLPPCHTQGHCLSLILSFPTHKSRLLSSRERIYQTDWPALSRLQVLGWTFLGLINIFFN